jgi:HSP20 family molecular chaperone IbpA
MSRRHRSVEPVRSSGNAGQPPYAASREDVNVATVERIEVKTESSSVEEHNTAVRKAIERRAYALYEDDHFKDGNDHAHWLQAEQELTDQDVPVLLDDEAITVRIATENFSPSAVAISISARSILILSAADDTSSDGEGLDRELLRFISLPVEVDPAQVTCAMNSGYLSLNLPLLKPISSADQPA